MHSYIHDEAYAFFCANIYETIEYIPIYSYKAYNYYILDKHSHHLAIHKYAYTHRSILYVILWVYTVFTLFRRCI